MKQLLGPVTANSKIVIPLKDGFCMSVVFSGEVLPPSWLNNNTCGVFVPASDSTKSSKRHDLRYISSRYNYDYTASLDLAKTVWIGDKLPEGPEKDALAAEMVEKEYRKILDALNDQWKVMHTNVIVHHDILGKVYSHGSMNVSVDHDQNPDLVAFVEEAQRHFHQNMTIFYPDNDGRTKLKEMLDAKKKEIDMALDRLDEKESEHGRFALNL